MAIQLSANYSKKLGLPQYSSHSFAASIQVELSDINQAEAEIQKLYRLLQHSVDQEIQHSGFVPQTSNGSGNSPTNGNNGRSYQNNGQSRQHSNGQQQRHTQPDAWNCTPGQKTFIQRIVHDEMPRISGPVGS